MAAMKWSRYLPMVATPMATGNFAQPAPHRNGASPGRRSRGAVSPARNSFPLSLADPRIVVAAQRFAGGAIEQILATSTPRSPLPDQGQYGLTITTCRLVVTTGMAAAARQSCFQPCKSIHGTSWAGMRQAERMQSATRPRSKQAKLPAIIPNGDEQRRFSQQHCCSQKADRQ